MPPLSAFPVFPHFFARTAPFTRQLQQGRNSLQGRMPMDGLFSWPSPVALGKGRKDWLSIGVGRGRQSSVSSPAGETSASTGEFQSVAGCSGRPSAVEADALQLAYGAFLRSPFFWRGFGPLVVAAGGIDSLSDRGAVGNDKHVAQRPQSNLGRSASGKRSENGSEDGGVKSPNSLREKYGKVWENSAAEDDKVKGSGVQDKVERGSTPEGIYLPDDLKSDILMLECESSVPSGKASVYILGTAHVSKESVAQVRKLVQLVRPQMVFIELCHQRVMMLDDIPAEAQKVPTLVEVLTALRERPGNAFAIVYGCLLAKVSDKMEVRPGEEFRAAYEEAVTLGAEVTLGDRPVHVTVKRTWARLSLWHRVKLIGGLMLQSAFLPSKEELQLLVEQMKCSDMLTAAVKDMSKQFPTLVETLVDERDQYMAATLRLAAKRSQAVVAVVGKGHLEGMAKHWGTHVDLQSLLEVAPPITSSWPYGRAWWFTGILVASTTVAIVVRSRRSH